MGIVVEPVKTYSTAPPEASSPALSRWRRSASLVLSQNLAPLIRAASVGEIGGESLEQAWTVVERICARGDAFTLGLWDDASYQVAETVEAAHAAIERIGAGAGDGYLSIKPPAFGFDSTIARELGRAAAKRRVRLHCDSHCLDMADPAFQFLANMAREAPAKLLSVSVPGRWRRSPADALRMLQVGIGIRIVKGQWPDDSQPDADLPTGFLAVAEAVKTAPGRIALASHDVTLLKRSLALLERRPGAVEIEAIHGLVTPLLRETASMTARPLRLYVPYGRGFVPSSLQILRRNPALGLKLVGAMMARRREPGSLTGVEPRRDDHAA